MTCKTTNKFSPEVRDRAVRMVLDHEGKHQQKPKTATTLCLKSQPWQRDSN